MCWDPGYVLLLLFSAIITWLYGFGAEKSQQRITRIAALWGTIVVNAGILFLFKYDNFFGDAIALIAAKIGISIKSV